MILDDINKYFSESSTLNRVLEELEEKDRVSVTGLGGSSKSFFLSHILKHRNSDLVYIAGDEEQAEIIRDDLETILGKDAVTFLPDQKERPYEVMFRDSSRKGMYQEALEKVINGQAVIVVTTAGAIVKKIIPTQIYKKQILKIKTNNDIDFEQFKSRLVDLGFNREPVVENCGEMSIRGGIVDIFPFSRQNPLRIEFFGNEIESIREFDVATQRSLETILQVFIYPQFPEQTASFAF